MGSRHLVTLVLFLAVAAVPALLAPRGGDADVDESNTVGEVPQEAVDALRRGRYWRASRILHQHLASAQDTSPRTLLMIAQADAGWGDWDSVHRLLANRPWLDEVSGGYGWKLLGRSLLERGDYEQGGVALASRRCPPRPRSARLPRARSSRPCLAAGARPRRTPPAHPHAGPPPGTQRPDAAP